MRFPPVYYELIVSIVAATLRENLTRAPECFVFTIPQNEIGGGNAAWINCFVASCGTLLECNYRDSIIPAKNFIGNRN